MIIQQYPHELDYVNVKLLRRPKSETDSFLGGFLMCCLRADAENYELLRPVLHKLMEKYPADPDDLESEREEHPR